MVGCNNPHRQIQSKLQALNPQPLMGPVYKALYHHALLVGRLLLGSVRTAGAAENPNYLTNIGPEPQPVKQTSEGVKLPLKPFRVSGRYQTILHIK